MTYDLVEIKWTFHIIAVKLYVKIEKWINLCFVMNKKIAQTKKL